MGGGEGALFWPIGGALIRRGRSFEDWYGKCKIKFVNRHELRICALYKYD